MLRVSGITVHYGRTAAVRDLSLTVAPGEIVGVIGANGAGKTTTMRAIVGLRRPAGGDVVFEGRSLVGMTPERIARQGIAMVPEGRRLFASLTVEENLMMGAVARARTGDLAEDLADLRGRFPVLDAAARTRAGRLSGGEQQQLALARALLARPRLLILDEPSLGLAPKVVAQLFEIVAELRDAGVTILLVEQNARKALELADRTYVLRAGQVVLEGTRAMLVGNPAVEAAYLGGGSREGDDR